MQLLVSNLPDATDERQLFALFSQFGEICKIQMVTNYKKGTFPRYAFVEMVQEEDGRAALQALNNFVVMGLNLDVKEVKGQSDQ